MQSLTDKQQKLAERLRRNENRIANLQKEYDAITVRLSGPVVLLVQSKLRGRGTHS